MQEEAENGNVVGLDVSTGEPLDPLLSGIYDNYLVRNQMLCLCPLLPASLSLSSAPRADAGASCVDHAVVSAATAAAAYDCIHTTFVLFHSQVKKQILQSSPVIASQLLLVDEVGWLLVALVSCKSYTDIEQRSCAAAAKCQSAAYC